MKRISLIIGILAVLSGCATNPERPTVELKYAERLEYVIRIPPEELLILPVQPPAINLEQATQSTIAKWLLDNENYMKQLRNQVVGIAKFLKNEQDKLGKEADEKNKSAFAPILAPMQSLSPGKK